MKKCVFAGTFDPFTVGHADTVEKCLRLFDETLIAVAENKRKSCLFTAQQRAEMISSAYKDDSRVSVKIWDGLIADLLKEENTPFYVRGVRNAADFEYETADFYASRDFNGEMITLYLPAEQNNLHISSTLVKNCISFGKPFQSYVPARVYDYMIRTIGEKNHV